MRTTCRWLVESLQAPNGIHLLENHDLPYFCPENPQLIFPGWSPEKQKVFNEECADIDGGRLPLAVVVGPWLLSNADISVKHTRGETRVELIEDARSGRGSTVHLDQPFHLRAIECSRSVRSLAFAFSGLGTSHFLDTSYAYRSPNLRVAIYSCCCNPYWARSRSQRGSSLR